MAGINLLGVLAEHIRANGTIQTGYAVYGTDGASPTILARAEGGRILIAEKTVKVMGQMNETFEMQGRVYDKSGLCPAIRTFQGGGLQPKIVDDVQDRDYGDIQPAQLSGESYKFLLEEAKKYRIRKLTPRECWRLMGFADEDFDRASSVNSNAQLYKQAGNSIVRQVLMALFSQLNIKGVKPWNERQETQ